MSEDNEKIAITPAWLNYKEAETYSNLSRITLWQLVKARKINAARIGRDLDLEAGMLQVRRTLSEPKGGYIFEAPSPARAGASGSPARLRRLSEHRKRQLEERMKKAGL